MNYHMAIKSLLFDMSTFELPPTHRALVLYGFDRPAQVEIRPTPQPGPGAIVVRVLAAAVVSYAHELYSGKRPEYHQPHPFVPGFTAVCRVAAIAPSTTTINVGQLVFFDNALRARDNQNAVYMQGVAALGEAGMKFALGEFRDGTFAEYARVPEENVHALDEARLLGRPSNGGLGYTVEDFAHLFHLCVTIGGLDDIGLAPGETALVAPATGGYSGSAVKLALALGAQVVAYSRNEAELARLRLLSPCVTTVTSTGNVDADADAILDAARGEVDVYIDVSPPAAKDSSHFKTCLKVLRPRGRISLIGGVHGGSAFWRYEDLFMKSVTMRASLQCTPEQVRRLVKLVTSGVLPLGAAGDYTTVGAFGLDDFNKALEVAAAHPGSGKLVVLKP